MTIETLLTEIRDELRAIRTDLNAPLKPELLAALVDAPTSGMAMSMGAIQHPQPPVVPLPPSAPAAPSTAAASPLETAPEASTDSLPPPTTVFGQAALPSGAVVIPVAATTAAAPAPLATTPGPLQTTQVGPELDIKGIPWDGRIHASSKNKVADGSWRLKRGVEPELVKQITEQIKQTMSAPAPAAGAGAPGLATQPWPFADPAAAGAVAPPPLNFAWLMGILPIKITAGELTPKMVTEACNVFGVPTLPDLAAREDLVPSVAKALGLTP